MTSIVKFEGVWGVGEEAPHCYLLTIDDFTFMLDCGWDEKFDRNYINRLSKISSRVDGILISYPDPLHMGALPYLVGKGLLSCPVYATTPVFKMGQMFMYDWYQSHQNYDEFEYFNLDDVDSAFNLIVQVKYNQNVPMRGKGMGLSISAIPAGHIIGGSIWRISRDGEEDIVYAVDFNHKKERHLGGSELEKLVRPSLLITDAFNATYKQERRRQRDEKFVAQLQETCRAGGNVLVATDTAGRVLEMSHMLEQMWSTKESGLSAYTIAILSNTSYHAVHFAKQMIEWMSEKLIKSFDVQRNNPFSFKHIKFCHNMNDLDRLPSPKVVLSSFPDLECGFSRELFIQWATNPKNTIILTSRSGKGTLARVLIDSPEVQTFRLVEKRRIKLDGDELDDYVKAKLREQKVKIKEELMIDSDDSDDEDEVNILEPGQHDIVVLHEKQGTQGLFRSKKHHPMFPFQEEKTKADDYGEFINLEEYGGEMKSDENKENLVNQIGSLKSFQDDEVLELEEVPTKCISQTVTVRLAAQVLFIDFEGRSDGESILKIMEALHPARIILVRGNGTDLLAFAQNLRAITKAKVYTPKLGDIVDASLEAHIYQIRLSESLVSSLLLQPASGGKDQEVAWVDGIVTYNKVRAVPQDPEEEIQQVISSNAASRLEIPTLNHISLEEAPYHDPVFINELRLSDFKQVLSRAGIDSEFSSGILWCSSGTVALRRQDTGTVSIEGCLSDDYFQIRDLLYSQYAIM